MNTLRNSVQLMGNIGSDVTLTTLDNGGKILKFRLATNEFYKDAKGERTQKTQWHNIIAWGKLAENMERILDKGNELFIKGKLEYNSYDDKDGVTRYVTNIVTQEFIKTTKKETAVTPF